MAAPSQYHERVRDDVNTFTQIVIAGARDCGGGATMPVQPMPQSRASFA
jgi:hypothetical protein